VNPNGGSVRLPLSDYHTSRGAGASGSSRGRGCCGTLGDAAGSKCRSESKTSAICRASGELLLEPDGSQIGARHYGSDPRSDQKGAVDVSVVPSLDSSQ